MNEIFVIEPRWHTDDLLIRNWGIENGWNKIRVGHHTFPDAMYMMSTQLWTYPIQIVPNKQGLPKEFRVVPVRDLQLSTEDYHIKQTNKEIYKIANQLF